MTVIIERDCYTAALIQALDRVGEKLGAWEQEFLVSVTERFFDQGRELSVKQLLRLEKMFRDVFPVTYGKEKRCGEVVVMPKARDSSGRSPSS